ncbi:MAG: ABC transporter substrate-binding protein [Deltaproteobacteria bacterium]|nr:ABC transporter substrate-binding protein [Deltaproteobacteria bacterium]
MLKIVIFILISFLSENILYAQPSYVNGIDPAYPPFTQVDVDGQIKGFDIDMINWIANNKGFKVSHQPVIWETLISDLQNDKIQLVASALSITEERSKEIAFSNPYWLIKQVILVRSDSNLSLEDVLKTGKKIGVQSDTSDIKNMEAFNGQEGRHYVLVAYESADIAALEVIAGSVDAVLINDRRGVEIAKELNLKYLGQAGIPDEQYAVGVNPKNGKLLTYINDGLDLIMKDPIWDELIKKHGLDYKF